MKNNLDMDGRLYAALDFDFGDVPELETMSDMHMSDFAKPIIDRVKQNEYGIRYAASSFESAPGSARQHLVLEVELFPKDIMAYLKFEKELKDEGYKVDFSREAVLGN